MGRPRVTTSKRVISVQVDESVQQQIDDLADQLGVSRGRVMTVFLLDGLAKQDDFDWPNLLGRPDPNQEALPIKTA